MGDENFYQGSKISEPIYSVKENYGGFIGYRANASTFGMALDPRTANQLQEVSNKLNTGAKTIEVQGVQANVLEAIPEQHLEEINRLKKLAGIDLTFHGPIVEPSGFNGREGWSEENRAQAERQMLSAVTRAHKLDPSGNIVVTFHTTAGLPEMMERIKTKEGEVTTEMLVYDESTGQAQRIERKEDYLMKEGKKTDVKERLKEMNKESWERALTTVGFHAHQGEETIRRSVRPLTEEGMPDDLKQSSVLDIYNIMKNNPKEGQELVSRLPQQTQQFVKEAMGNINYGEIHVKDAYNEMKTLYDKAYKAAIRTDNKEDIAKLNEYGAELRANFKKYADPKNLPQFAEEITKGVQILSALKSNPEVFRPLNDFVLDKSGETFGNIAYKAYNEFKKDKTAPIISIENPPAGGGLSRGEDLRKLVEISRNKFVEKAVADGMDKEKAVEAANNHIGVTWDVGHINMIRKFGYDQSDVVKETKKVADMVKHVHLSDNFGFEHTELPMGMGNVPTKEHLEAIGEKVKKMKKIVETGDWYQHFKTSPFAQTLEAFGSPIYAMKMAPYWNQARGMTQGYFSGYGRMLPDQHFSVYGAGFSSLPTELGGQITGRSRLSGTPTE